MSRRSGTVQEEDATQPAADRRVTAAGPTQDTQEQVVIEETLLEAEEKMEKAVVVAKDDFAAIRTGRAHPAMFNKIVADYYGAPTPINQLASFSVPEPRMAVVTPFDKSALRNIEQAIRDSDLGVNPSNDATSSAWCSPS